MKASVAFVAAVRITKSSVPWLGDEVLAETVFSMLPRSAPVV